MKSLPVQPAGWVVFGVGVVTLVGALILNWRELLVLAVGCGAILLLSLAFVVGRSEVALRRTMDSDRVTVGDAAIVELHATNTGSVRTTRQIITEAIDGVPVPVPLPALAPGAERTVSWKPPTKRRGRYRLGPARITKADPCRLMQREVGQTGVDELWVQPRVARLPTMVGGLTKDIDGPTYDHSPAGDVAFHAVRPYRAGDDARHVHWMATARAGEMMVRHYVDNRQPYVSVVLDTNDASWASAADFDAAVDIVASLGVSSLDESHPTSVRAGANVLVGANRRSTRQLLLDDLTLVTTDAGFDLSAQVASLMAAERNTTIAIVITGTKQNAADLRAPVTSLGSSASVLVVQVGESPNEDLAALAGRSVTYLAVADLDSFVDETRVRAVL